MPGFNHYSSCGCGWCVNNGRAGFVVWDGHRADALVTLRQYGADSSRAARFIDHNARCPVCNARVFYYQNQHGSRVFFDDLAPLWTKHPCTDNRPPSGASRLAFRGRGALAEISAALGAAGVTTSDEWWFGIVGAIVQKAGQVELHVRFTQEASPRILTFRGSAVPIAEGEVVGLKNGEISFFDLDAMEARIAAVGSEIQPVPLQPAGRLSLVAWEAALLRRGDWNGFLQCWRAPPYAAEMLAAEVCNFHAPGMDIAAFGKRMTPWVAAAWQDGRRSLTSMAEYFDAIAVRTACGLRWNERRVYLLLKLMYSQSAPPRPSVPVKATPAGGSATDTVVRPPRRWADIRAPWEDGARDGSAVRSKRRAAPAPDRHRRDLAPASPDGPIGLDLTKLAALGRLTIRKPGR